MSKVDEDYIRANFGAIYPAHVENLTLFLIECRRHFHGDLDLLLTLCVIGDRTLSRRNAPPTLTYQEMLHETYVPIATEGVNARSIAEFTGIPRETVRRKVRQLVDLGWIDRDKNGFLYATRLAAIELAPLSETTFKYIARMAKFLCQV